MLLEVLVALVVGVFTLWFICYLKFYLKLQKIPSPKVWPIIGSALEFKNAEDSMNIFPRIMKQLKAKTIRLHMGFNTILVTADYALIERVLSSSSMIHRNYYMFVPWMGGGLFTAPGDKWRKSRKVITPTFHFKILEQFLNVFNSNGNILINKLRKQVNTPSLDIFRYMNLCTLDVICETAMGISVNAQSNDSSEYVKCIEKITNILQVRRYRPFYNIEWVYKKTKLHRDEQAVLKILHGHTDTVIKMRRQKLQEEAAYKAAGNKAENEDDIGLKNKVPFLDLLLKTTIDGKPLSDRELRDEVTTFMFGGHDTTAGAMSFTLYAIANHDQVQAKASDELFRIFGDDKKRMCTMADINEMKYLEMVIKESLRMYPTAPQIGRTVTENINHNGTLLPQGMHLVCLVYSIHHDPDYYPHPEKFDPERFSPENYDRSKPFSYIPFSAGPRNCIGRKFAMIEMKCLLSMILRQFELKPATPEHKLKLQTEITLKSVNGIKIAFSERKH